MMIYGETTSKNIEPTTIILSSNPPLSNYIHNQAELRAYHLTFPLLVAQMPQQVKTLEFEFFDGALLNQSVRQIKEKTSIRTVNFHFDNDMTEFSVYIPSFEILTKKFGLKNFLIFPSTTEEDAQVHISFDKESEVSFIKITNTTSNRNSYNKAVSSVLRSISTDYDCIELLYSEVRINDHYLKEISTTISSIPQHVAHVNVHLTGNDFETKKEVVVESLKAGFKKRGGKIIPVIKIFKVNNDHQNNDDPKAEKITGKKRKRSSTIPPNPTLFSSQKPDDKSEEPPRKKIRKEASENQKSPR